MYHNFKLSIFSKVATSESPQNVASECFYTKKNLFEILLNQPEIRYIYHFSIDLDPNQSENGKYKLISGWFNKILKRFLCVEQLRKPDVGTIKRPILTPFLTPFRLGRPHQNHIYRTRRKYRIDCRSVH